MTTNMSREELLSLIDDVRSRIERGDSMEGRLHYVIGTRKDRPFEVAAIYRIDQTLGHGTTQLVGVENPFVTIRCTRCDGDDGPFTQSGVCEACARPVPLAGAM